MLYRNDLTLEQLLKFMKRVRKAIPSQIPIGYVDAYYEFSLHPELVEHSDVILSNCIPFGKAAPKNMRLIICKTCMDRHCMRPDEKRLLLRKRAGLVRVSR